MNRSLFRTTIIENNLINLIYEYNLKESDEIRAKFENKFLKTNIKNEYYWENFIKIYKKLDCFNWKDLFQIINDLNYRNEKNIIIMSDAFEDKILIKTQLMYLERLLDIAWYPSDDLYIIDKNLSWCISLTHHDFIIISKVDC